MTLIQADFVGKHRIQWAEPDAPEFKPGPCSTPGCKTLGVVTRTTYLPDKKRRHTFCKEHLPDGIALNGQPT